MVAEKGSDLIAARSGLGRERDALLAAG
jgi:hypothetical protein